MKMAVIGKNGKVSEDQGVGLTSQEANYLWEATMLQKYVADELSENFEYLKLQTGKSTYICGFSEGKLLVIVPESEAEEIEAVNRFKK